MCDQYVFGYGSLMERESRTRTNPQAVSAYPAIVKGVTRGWYHRVKDPIGFTTTYLGAKLCEKATCNGVIYPVEDIKKTDHRESGYFRHKLPPESITMLDGGSVPKGKIYVYLSEKEDIHLACPQYPIVQSYVDICMNGCLEIEEEYRLAEKGFAKRFIETTTCWSEHWVNDRIYPRRPFIYVPRALAIDELLDKYIPEYFDKIKIE
ncbi:gamma-glutamylcyclotransferase [Candidatus Poribacteria bacterium]|nr:gamma-glutamylcyclotransferase [Candidatus Poribacteria bacterium]